MGENADRLRVRPHERFADPEQWFDLEEQAESLLAEKSTNVHGHRQIALYQHGPMTVGLWVFEPGGSIPDHEAAGPVMIQALQGTLVVRVSETDRELGPGQLLVLAPHVEHSVSAPEGARMLLTVCLEEPGREGGAPTRPESRPI